MGLQGKGGSPSSPGQSLFPTPEVEDDLCGRATLRSAFVRVTAPGQGGVDYVSRFFPPIGIDEDPATGSMHCPSRRTGPDGWVSRRCAHNN
jgi:predicted PhzF superfamily epimerase YddE/YHI9